ncbi:hypothetical protein D9758_006021 [Tetrapyrgos nigripes]|uniref:Aminotransferase class V domain-containing protein n=1 Tax=Tetrapyrgos nigripes TaxID=182062 RepID=A0A8H5D8Q7_9AGAR|nr:hypothetical protein D9758_006021 [Tetrapyrgos nigripes]
MSNKIVPTIYRHVIDEVISNIKGDFEKFDVSEDILAELQHKWENKVIQSRVADFEVATQPPASSIPPQHHPYTTQSHPHAHMYGAAPPGPHSYAPQTLPHHYAPPPHPGVKTEPMDPRYMLNGPQMLYAVPPLPGPQLNGIRPSAPTGQASMLSFPPGAQGSSTTQNGVNGSTTAPGVPLGRPYIPLSSSATPSAAPAPPSGSSQSQSQPTAQASSNSGGGGSGGRIPQLDGPSEDESDEDSRTPPPLPYVPRSNHPSLPQVPAESQTSSSAADAEAINSDLDDSDIDDEDDEKEEGSGVDTDIVTRVKNKWRCTFKDGIIHVNGKDYLFAKCNGTMSSAAQFKQAPHKLLASVFLISNSIPTHPSSAFQAQSKSLTRFCTPMHTLPCPMCPRNSSQYLNGRRYRRWSTFLNCRKWNFGLGPGTSRSPNPVASAPLIDSPSSSGYFGDSFADCLETYGANVDQVKAEIGAAVTPDQIESALKQKKYKLLTFSHVDTSTAVLSDAKVIAETVRRVSPETLVILDGVCSVASEEIHMDAWNIDVVLTASQKGLGTPPGLSILVASKRAMQVFETRKSRPTSYYASWKNWLPIMRAYESSQPAYFATPPVNLIYAFNTSLTSITKTSSVSLAERYALHREVSSKVKSAAKELGLKQVPLKDSEAANGMTALYYPEGLGAGDILPRLVKKGVVVAGGLHKSFKDTYFRIGHMGITAVEKDRQDAEKVIQALKEALEEARAEKK